MSPELVKVLSAAAATAAAAVSVTAWWTAKTQLRRLHAESTTDALTGLLNRRGWEQTTASWPTTTNGASDFVILADCNGLKAVNDQHGHEAGDAIIRDAAAVLRSVFPTAVCARLGGDEFAVLATWSQFGSLRTRRQPMVATTDAFAPGAIRSRLAIGAARFDGDLADAMRRADAAMYRNKVTGDGLMCVFERDCDDHSTENRPQVRTRDLEATGAERFAARLQPVGSGR